MPELVMVMLIVGILAAYALPKFTAAFGTQDDSWRDQVKSSLTFAQRLAVARRRLVCVNVSATAVTITSASANPSTTCPVAIRGPDGAADFATAEGGSMSTTLTPSGVLYFQPDGRVTSDAAGASVRSQVVISMTGVASLTLYGETGFVE